MYIVLVTFCLLIASTISGSQPKPNPQLYQMSHLDYLREMHINQQAQYHNISRTEAQNLYSKDVSGDTLRKAIGKNALTKWDADYCLHAPNPSLELLQQTQYHYRNMHLKASAPSIVAAILNGGIASVPYFFMEQPSSGDKTSGRFFGLTAIICAGCGAWSIYDGIKTSRKLQTRINDTKNRLAYDHWECDSAY